jgi:hypothetical protein
MSVVMIFIASIFPTLAFAQAEPDDLVRALYSAYGTTCNAKSESSGLNRSLANRLFDKRLAKAYRNAKWIDADFFIDGQDWCIIKTPDIKVVSKEKDSAKVSASVTLDDNFKQGKPKIRVLKIRFDIHRTREGWRISDAYDGSYSFLRSLKGGT